MRTFASQKAGLTRALKTKDPEKILAEVHRTMAEWDEFGVWPDAWHRWQIAEDDARLEQARRTW